MSIYCNQQAAQAKKKRLGMVDERYMKQAERLLYGELSAALGIPPEEVQPYIARRLAGAPAGSARETLPQCTSHKEKECPAKRPGHSFVGLIAAIRYGR
jgi:hypothetical protein